MDALAASLAGWIMGLKHGLGPDHCAALASLLVGSPLDRSRALSISLRFGLGHAFVLAFFVSGASLVGAAIPESWERIAEMFGGLLLFAMGVVVLRHGTLHAPTSDAPRATLIGGVFALSGVRGLLLSLPALLLARHDWMGIAGYVLTFGIGVTTAMVGFGLAFGWARSAGDRFGRIGARLPSTLVGGFAVLLGLFWVGNNLVA
jgi:nickel/cobalt exporter